ncbi:MAG: acyl-CoA mutase large subunit family protein, partial [Alphaproteobacteria bacterium]
MDVAKKAETRTEPAPSPKTLSGIDIPAVATPEMRQTSDASLPGEFPYTRGIFPDGYRGRLWTFRQYSGFGTAEESNQRYRFLLDQGQSGLSVAFDLPSQCGLDPTDPLAWPEVGKVGVSLSHLAEMEILYDGIDLAKISTSFTINGTAAMVYAMYVALADKTGVPRAKLTGTIQNDILKEYVARGTWIFPVRPSMRLIADTIMFGAEETPRFNAISIAGAHFKEAGMPGVEAMANTIGCALAYMDELIARGADVNKVAKRMPFFFCVHMDFFEEICTFRAARRVWAHIMKDRYGATDEDAMKFRFGIGTGGSTLTAAQPYNNIARVTIEALAAVLGGAQSVFTTSYDEAFQIPTEQSVEIALRTQQIIAHESGVANSVDPLGGSYFVETLTDRIEAEILRVLQEIEDYGGMVKTVEEGMIQMRV